MEAQTLVEKVWGASTAQQRPKLLAARYLATCNLAKADLVAGQFWLGTQM
jgi:hypothetical protein